MAEFDDPYEQALRQQLGLEDPPAPDEGLDIFQPIRTAFGATQSVGGQLAGLFAPEAYQKAAEERTAEMGLTPDSPWYEKTEALPGLGDVLAQTVPESVSSSLPGRIFGPIGRLAGNIAGDPTSYLGVGLAKAGNALVRSTELGAEALTRANMLRQAGAAAKAANDVENASKLFTLADEVVYGAMQHAPAVKRLAWKGAEIMAAAEPLALGAPAAVAYGPGVLKSVWEGGGQAIDQAREGQYEDALVSGANTALMAGLAVLMGKGLLDANKAREIVQNKIGRELSPGEFDAAMGRAANAPGEPPPDVQTSVEDQGPVAAESQPPPAEAAAPPPRPEGPPAAGGPAAGTPPPDVPVVPPPTTPEGRFAAPEQTGRSITPEGREQVVADEAAGAKKINENKAADPDAQYKEAVAFIQEAGQASTSMLQRRFRIGYSRASAYIDRMEKEGLIGPANGKKAREIVKPQQSAAPEPTSPQTEVASPVREQTSPTQTAPGEPPATAPSPAPAEPPPTTPPAPADAQPGRPSLLPAAPEASGAEPVDVEATGVQPEPASSETVPEKTHAVAPPAETVAAAAETSTSTEQKPIKWGHKDHNLTQSHITTAEDIARQWPADGEPHITTVKVDEPLPNALYGPRSGDAPVADAEAIRRKRPDRDVEDRMVRKPTRQTNELTVIGTNTPDGPQIWTAHGGPAAEPHPSEAWLTPEARAKSEAFWKEHALATGETLDKHGKSLADWYQTAAEKAKKKYKLSDAEHAQVLEAAKSGLMERLGIKWLEEHPDQTMGEAQAFAFKQVGEYVKSLKEGSDTRVRGRGAARGEGGQSVTNVVNPGEALDAVANKATGAAPIARRTREETVGRREQPKKETAVSRIDAAFEAAREKARELNPNAPALPVQEWRALIEKYLTDKKGQQAGKGMYVDNAAGFLRRFAELRDSGLDYEAATKKMAVEGKTTPQSVRTKLNQFMPGIHETMSGVVTEKAPATVATKPNVEAAKVGLAELHKKVEEGIDGLLKDPNTPREAAQKALEDYAQFIARRAQVPGAGRSLPDRALKQFGKEIGADPKPKERTEQLLKRITEKLGLEWEPISKKLVAEQQSQLRAAASAARAKAVVGTPKPEGFKVSEGKELVDAESTNGTKVKLSHQGGNRWVVQIERAAKTVDGYSQDLQALLGDDRVTELHVQTDRHAKAFEPLVTEGKVDLVRENDDVSVYRVKKKSLDEASPDRVENMAARDRVDVMDPDFYNDEDMGHMDLSVSPVHTQVGKRLEQRMNTPTIAYQVVKPIADALGIKIDRGDPVIPLGHGFFHQVFVLNGVGPKGETGVVRIGKSPILDFPTQAQRDLVIPTLKKGVMKIEGENFTYTVSPLAKQGVAFNIGELGGAELASRFGTTTTREMSEGAQLETAQFAKQVLPDGVSLGDYLDDSVRLLDALNKAGLEQTDIHYTLELPQLNQTEAFWRGQNTAYVPVSAEEAKRSIARQDSNGRWYKLVVADAGSVFPRDRPGEWARIPKRFYVAFQRSLHDTQLSIQQRASRSDAYHLAEANGIDLEDGTKVVSHDGVTTPEYDQRVAELGDGISGTLAGIAEDLAGAVKLKFGVDGEISFGGLTTSPYLAGLFTEFGGKGKMYANLVEAIHATGSREEAARSLVDTIIHELSHKWGIDEDHGVNFQKWHKYIEGHVEAEKLRENYIAQVLDALDPDVYDQIKSELVPQFKQMRDEISGRATAAAQQRVPNWYAPRSTQAEPYRLGGGAKAPPADRVAGVQPGGAVERGAEGATGQLRSAAVPEAGAAEGYAPAEGAGPTEGRIAAAGAEDVAALGKRGSVMPREQFDRLLAEGWTVRQATLQEAWPQHNPTNRSVRVVQLTPNMKGPYVFTPPKDRMAGMAARRVTVDEAKSLINSIFVRRKIRGESMGQIANEVWRNVEDLYDSLTPEQREEISRGLPSPRREGQVDSALNVLHLSPDISEATKAKLKLFSDLTAGQKDFWARDTPRPWAEVDRQAAELIGAESPEAYAAWAKRRGGHLSDAEMRALHIVHNELVAGMQEAQARYYDTGGTGGTPEQLAKAKAEMENAIARWVNVARTYAKAGTETARALAIRRMEALRMNPRARMEADFRAAVLERTQTRFKKEIAQAKADELTKAFMDLFDKKQNMSEFMKAYNMIMGRNIWPDKALEWYKMGLLGWPSEIANVASNTLMLGTRQLESTVAGLIDAAVTKLGLKKSLFGAEANTRDIYVGEASVAMLAMQHAMAEGWKPFRNSVYDNFMLKPEQMETMLKNGALSEDLFHQVGAIGGKLGEFVRFHGKMMNAADQYAKHVSAMNYLYREIYRKLRKGEFQKNAGESWVQATQRIAGEARSLHQKYVEDVPMDRKLYTTKYEKLFADAEKVAKDETFQADLGNLGRGFQSFVSKNPIMQILFPFVRTPTNIAKQTVERTPFGFVQLAKKWKELSPEERVSELSKPLVGTGIMMAFASLAMNGKMTGGGPVDFESQDALRAMGWQPYSFKVGNEWVSYSRLEPVASILGFSADMVEAMKRGETGNIRAFTEKALNSIADNLTNKTFLDTMDKAFAALSRPQQYGPQFIKQLQSSVIPNSIGFVPFGHLAKALDPVYRQTEPLSADVFLSKIPFASQRLAPQYGPTGEERKRTGTFPERLFSPFMHQAQKSGAKANGTQEIVRLEAVPKTPMKQWLSPQGYQVPLSPEERKKLAVALSEATTVVGQRLLSDPGYQRLPDDENDPRYKFGQKTKQDVVKNLIGKYRDNAFQQIKPQLQRRAYQLYRGQE